MKYLCDTNVLSELTRPLPNQNVINRASSVTKIYVSVITAEEIYFGLTRRTNARILNWFEMFLKGNCKILHVNSEIAKCAGELRGRLSIKGQVRSQADMLIGATALSRKLILVTRNESDFRDCGINILNPFSDPVM